MSWFWNPRAARYQWRNGRARFLSRATVLGYIEETIAQTGNATGTLAQLVSDGMLAPADWRAAMRQYIKDEYIRQGVLGAGGRAQMTQQYWGVIGGGIADQYRFLDGFAEQVAAGDLSEAQIAARSRMYINSAREAYEKILQRQTVAAGFDEVRWVLDPPAEHCPDCQEFAALDWTRIEDDAYEGAFPGSAATVCLSNCACHLEYRKSPEAQAAEEEE